MTDKKRRGLGGISVFIIIILIMIVAAYFLIKRSQERGVDTDITIQETETEDECDRPYCLSSCQLIAIDNIQEQAEEFYQEAGKIKKQAEELQKKAEKIKKEAEKLDLCKQSQCPNKLPTTDCANYYKKHPTPKKPSPTGCINCYPGPDPP